MQNTLASLPIDAVLPELSETLRQNNIVILQAEPGAGKTTRVPLALLNESFIAGKILLLEPRRVAARSAAAFMAQSLQEKLGQRVGYSMRLERKTSQATQVEVITEGLLLRRLLQDPELSGVDLVIFDEFHERSIHTDIGLALCREVAAMREKPLKLLIMSATLDTEQLQTQLHGAPVLSSEGRSFNVEIERTTTPIHRHQLLDAAQRRCIQALQVEGDVLVFLPGRAEIRQLERRLVELWHDRPDVEVVPLYSGVNEAQIEQLFEPPQPPHQRFILATSIAQTSITLPGVCCVIDSGFERKPKYDPSRGVTRLATQRISTATATQRAGRAGRVRAGLCYQLWSEEQHRQLGEHDAPQIRETDFTDTLLQLLSWGVHRLTDLEWIEPPSTKLWDAAITQLDSLDALAFRDGRPYLSDLGKRMSDLPMDARSARLLIEAERLEAPSTGAALAALISEPPLRSTADLSFAIEDMPQRSRQLATRFKSLLQNCPNETEISPSRLALAAYPDRVAQCVNAAEGRFKLYNGTAVRLDPTDRLCREKYIICLNLGGREDRADLMLTQGLPVSIEEIYTALEKKFRHEELLSWEGEHLRAIKRTRLGELELKRQPSESISTQARSAAWCERIRREGLELLPQWPELAPWLARINYLRMHQERASEPVELPDMSSEMLLTRVDEWLGASLGEIKQRAQLRNIELKTLLLSLLPWQVTQWLETYVPRQFRTPSGRLVEINYTSEIPSIAVKLQEMFGQTLSPKTGLGLPLRVELLSPAGRPLAMTTDLPHFWQHIYPDVRKENRGRYSKHPWPEDPSDAEATHLTNAALRRRNAGQ